MFVWVGNIKKKIPRDSALIDFFCGVLGCLRTMPGVLEGKAEVKPAPTPADAAEGTPVAKDTLSEVREDRKAGKPLPARAAAEGTPW